ncbi:ABC transporter ATP-binding protein [Ancylobacter sp. 6x-1]|uniref:ABC transporter ATP-binding protein n=1 Tax=Ancylobacter crimeensis TaxID=2579147 RepID=A0ABT0D6Y1_9HYPH|nr:ABC transporter ATP-binding protein [Ancylobacter crimeensis]MCK0195718.1 ABC transporter ATP-binding protein [Ancylobacter crimeensis]
MPGDVAALELAGLRKSYGNHPVVQEVDLRLPRGALLTLLGPSGCGKSTLLRMIAGFVEPSAGDILINGRSILPLRPERRPTAMVFQSYALFPHMTVFDNVAFGLRLRATPRAQLGDKVRRALALVRMDPFEARFPSELSGGQQQRVALARCLVVEPEILLLDEPFGALDRHLREEMQVEMRKLQRQLGVTMVVVTHDQEEALVLSDYIAVMRAGAIEQFAEPIELYDRPANRFVASFMGVSNLIDGTLERGGETSFRFPGGAALAVASALPSGPVTLAIRPEAVRLCALDDRACRLAGTVAFTSLVGSRLSCEIKVDDAVLTALIPRHGSGPVIGERVGLAIAEEQLQLFPR